MSDYSPEHKELSKSDLIPSILKKMKITSLNPMQEEGKEAIQSKSDVVLLSPTGTGKTLAFLLPLIEMLDPKCSEIQLIIIVPSRELAQQIEQVVRKMGSGFKVNAVYGGRSGSLDKITLKHRPAILIGTPGRVADRLRRDNYSIEHLQALVLDEYDKSFEMGFEREMSEIIDFLPGLKQLILTSATSNVKTPDFIEFQDLISINYLKQGNPKLDIKILESPDKDKLESLKSALDSMGNKPGIVFCNFKDSLARVSEFLKANNINHECFHGGMEQLDREKALVKFRNGTSKLLLATDLAARGLDVPEIEFILHYHLPSRNKEFTHRNGRTARMKSDGIAYVLHWRGEKLPDFIQVIDSEIIQIKDLKKTKLAPTKEWTTLFINGGRQDKISKGDIAGLFFKQAQIGKEQLGIIELQQKCTRVAVHAEVAELLVKKLNNSKLKKKKLRISIL